MSLVFLDSFDTMATADLVDRYTVAGAPAIVAGAGRFGGPVLRITANAQSITRSFAPARSTFVLGATVRVASLPSVAAAWLSLVDAGTVQCSLVMNPDGSLAIYRSTNLPLGVTSAPTLSIGVWHSVEWKVTIADSIAANSCKVRVDGADWITVAAGIDLKATSAATANACRIVNIMADYDEFSLCNGDGSVNNDFLGDVKVTTLRPTGAGATTAWTPSTGANWQNVDDPAPNDDTDYNSTATVNAVDTFALADLPAVPSAIPGVMASIQVRKDDAGSRQVALVLRSNGVDYAGTSQPVLDAYSSIVQVWETDPATGLPWTAAGVNSLEVGYKLVS